MRKLRTFSSLLLSISMSLACLASPKPLITGKVVGIDGAIPYASIYIKGSTQGTLADEGGRFTFKNLKAGKHVFVAHALGFKTQEQEIKLDEGDKLEVNFQLDADALHVDEVVVTGGKRAETRAKAVSIVNSIPAQMLQNTSAATLSEGLNFVSGLRMENNCQNCGFSQVRMNGLEGPYSQILINGAPIFSGLANVYGLELIPANIIEKIEVVRGGGSAIYGGNAIAGTINMRLKTPKKNSFNLEQNHSIIGLDHKAAHEHSTKADLSVVNEDKNTGMSLYAFKRKRAPYDANGDGFSEITQNQNTTFGGRLYRNLGFRDKISLDFFVIEETRRGGNRFDYLPHEADIAEELKHYIQTGAVQYTKFFRQQDVLNVFASAQHVNRAAYYGAERSLDGYGQTDNLSLASGADYVANFDLSNWVSGFEFRHETIEDTKLGSLQLDAYTKSKDRNSATSANLPISDQLSNTLGVFSQYEYEGIRNLKLSAGARLDRYQIQDRLSEKSNSNWVLAPRVNFLYDLTDAFQIRGSYSSGYRAPQLFNEDLHIEISGARRLERRNAANLTQETSHSFLLSSNLRQRAGQLYYEFLAEGFYTLLDNPFVSTPELNEETDAVIFTRRNASEGAFVAGLNAEFRLRYGELELNSGFTSQISQFEKAQDVGTGNPILEKNFLRTPRNYGFFVLDYDFTDSWCLNMTGTYTGSMTLVHQVKQEVRHTPDFFDLGTKLTYQYRLGDLNLDLFVGLKNFLNAYQEDFDSGVQRDSDYVYGPMAPRSFFTGIRLSSF